MVISISASLLTTYLDAKYNIGDASTSTTSSAATAPTPPWQSTSTAPQQSALVSSVLKGSAFFSSSTTTQLAAPAGTSTADYNNLFTLYQGINALQGLATDASATGLSASQQAAYATAFTTGMTQLQTFLGKTSFSGLNVTEGTLTASDVTKEGAPQETDTYTTGTIYSGTADGVVPAFQGAVSFAMNLTDTSGATKTVNFDLSQMGSTPRTMANVVSYMNAQLKAAGATTKFSVVDTPAAPVKTTVNGQSVTLSTPPDNFALEITGTPTEAVTFTASATSPAVYVTAASGTPASVATSLTAAVVGDQTQQLMKFNTAASSASTAVVNSSALASVTQSALASATAPDGSVYVVANVNGTVAGQTINGAQDVALMKYDSAGNLVYTRTLGAADSATGYAIAVSGNGDDVAVAGSVTGALDEDDPGESATSTNSFVTEYDSAGDEQWTTTQPSTAGDVTTAVAFGSDGSVYTTGTTQAALPDGGGEIGGQDGFVRGYTPDGTITSTEQFGTTGTDTPAGITVSGSSIYVAGAENGDAVVRQFNIQSPGAFTAGAVQNLGALGDGAVVGVGVNTDGSVVVAGSTTNGALAAGTVNSAYQSGQEGFVASLSASLQPSSLSYVATSGDLTASAMTLSGGQVYLAGQVATTPPNGSGLTNTANGYVAAIDPSTGAVTWSQQIQGQDDLDQPTSIAVSQTGSSVLDQLGLPTSIDYGQSTLIVSNTSIRAGDSFYIQSGSGTPQKITIQSTDTLQSLATEIQQASGYTATATTSTINGQAQLTIKADYGETPITLTSGPTGEDALAGLGLSPGQVNVNANATSTASQKAKVSLGLNLTSSLNLNSTSAISAAKTALNLASAKIQNAYQSLANPTGSTTASTEAPSQYVENQIANYQSALSWLENNEGTTTSSSSLLL